jgi:uncharacterized protein with HEPN domain
MKKDPRVYLVQILERAERIHQFTEGGRVEFFGSPLIQDAVLRNFEIIGEAAKRVPEEFRQLRREGTAGTETHDLCASTAAG